MSEKANDPIFGKLSDGRTGGQTEESNFIGRCPTNVESPIIYFVFPSFNDKLFALNQELIFNSHIG